MEKDEVDALLSDVRRLVEAARAGLAPNALNCVFYPQADDDAICCCGKPKLYHWKNKAKQAIAAVERYFVSEGGDASEEEINRLG